MQLGTRFVTLIYPFQYASDLCRRGRKQSNRRMRVLAERWAPWWHRLDDDETRQAVTDGNFFLPYVRELLYPEVDLLPTGSLDAQVREVRRLKDVLSADELVARLAPETVIRLTLNERQLDPIREMTFKLPDAGSRQWSIRLCWVDLLLFPQRVGFLLLRLVPNSPELDVDSWADLLHAMAMVHPPFLEWTLPTWEMLGSSGRGGITNRLLVEFLLQGWTLDETPLGFRNLFDLSVDDDGRPHYTRSALGRVYGARFHLQTYACANGGGAAEGGVEVGDALFTSPAEKALFHLGIGLSPDSDSGRPHPRRVEDLRVHSSIAIWDNWQGLVLSDRVVFLATRSTSFTEGPLPRNIGSEYLMLHLLTLFQKIRLSLMNGELLRRGQRPRQHRRESQALWEDFITFQNHYWYSEVTPLEQGKLLYARFQEGLNALPLYEQMKEEVRQLHQYYERRTERRVQGLLNFLTFIGLPLGLWVSLFGPTLFEPAAMRVETSWLLALGSLGGLFAPVVLLWIWWLRRP